MTHQIQGQLHLCPARPTAVPHAARIGDSRGEVGAVMDLVQKPARAFPPSIFRDKHRCDLGKSQSQWTASKMETAGALRREHYVGPLGAHRRRPGGAGGLQRGLQSGAVADAVAQHPRRQHGREGIAGTHRVHEQLVLHHLAPTLQALPPPPDGWLRTEDEIDRNVGESQSLIQF
jgi:hypothetical protein